MTIKQEYLTSDQAIYIFNTVSCTVKMHIALGVYKTRIGVNNNLIFVDGFNDMVHVHNIASIMDEEKKIFIPIDWTTEQEQA